MRASQEMPDVERILGGLKDFQRKTVDYVFRRLYLDHDRVDRFLIADEVGLGKTLVARGVVAKAIEQIWDDVPRIDIVYICANRSIARQNVNRLNVTGQREIAIATRMTMLPMHLHNLHGNKINFVSFTPGTSFDLRSSGGVARERALIYHILRQGWQLGNTSGPKNLLQGYMCRENWIKLLKTFPADEIDLGLAQDYLNTLGTAGLRPKFDQLAERFWYSRKNVPQEDQQDRFQLIGELRTLLAKSCVDALEPDIVILDEFQRFKTLLDGDNEVARLAKAVFDFSNVKVLLLSATPYKMYSTYDEDGDDHYSDFLRTVGFLFDSPEKTEAFEKDLAAYRRALLDFEFDDGERLLKIRQGIEETLRKVIVRTERLSVSADRSGMLEEARDRSGKLTAGDLKAYAALDKVARQLGVGETLEYWKSAPYLLNVMERDGYKVKKLLVSQAETPSVLGLVDLCKDARACMLSWNKIQRYVKLDAGNAKLRDLLANKVESGGWKLLWVPPAMPYYEPVKKPHADPELKEYTKALVFSSWTVAPKAIAMLASYEAERRMVKSFDQIVDYTTERKRRPPLLRFAFSQDRPTGMSVFPLIYPCLALASMVDPLDTSRDLSQDGTLPRADRVRNAIRAQVEEVLSPLLAAHSTSGGQPDERWYWAALAMLDREYCEEPAWKWLSSAKERLAWPRMVRSVEGSDGKFAEHVAIFRDAFQKGIDLGRPPADLADVLAKAALASPAVAALRAFLRVLKVRDLPATMEWLLAGAARATMGFRTLFNLPETITLLRSLDRQDDTRYWETALDYCVSGNLQSVLDEYVHVLKESLGLIDQDPEVTVTQLAEEIQSAVSIRTVNLDFDEIHVNKRREEIRLDRRSMRCRFALRFGDGRNEEEGFETRADQVRSAFNSPFRPFVLASTSIGQEGLDFHQYCHEIYHWNLPSNPVDLEQREGRIHRYKGHVIRKNVAKAFPFLGFEEKTLQLRDPWELAFEMARSARLAELNDLIPFWIYDNEGGNKIVRHVPALPLSREVERLEQLRKALVAYRMVLGQPRQQDLVEYLQQRFESGVDPEEFSKFRVDLSPA
jgi:hypothetical protein